MKGTPRMRLKRMRMLTLMMLDYLCERSDSYESLCHYCLDLCCLSSLLVMVTVMMMMYYCDLLEMIH